MKYLIVLLPLLGLAMADLSLFKLIRFQNAACEGNSNMNGTCYTKQECDDRGGKESGSCADNYGVCCVFSIDECDKTVKENNTYVMNPTSVEAGQCTTKICPVHDDICKLRLEFNTLSIAAPNSDATAAFTTVGGTALTNVGRCMNDVFRITCPGGPSPSPICGTVTGQHMYVDAAESCNDLTFDIGTASASRSWNVRVIQIACTDYENLPPPGCLQWFTDDKGEVQSFNFGLHLANQEQKICVRRNEGFCRVCLAPAIDTDFDLSHIAASAVTSPDCCNEAAHGDCLIIPGARDLNSALKASSEVCAQAMFGGAATGTICTRNAPFSFTFYSNAGELAASAADHAGFKLQYEQKTCN